MIMGFDPKELETNIFQYQSELESTKTTLLRVVPNVRASTLTATVKNWSDWLPYLDPELGRLKILRVTKGRTDLALAADLERLLKTAQWLALAVKRSPEEFLLHQSTAASWTRFARWQTLRANKLLYMKRKSSEIAFIDLAKLLQSQSEFHNTPQILEKNLCPWKLGETREKQAVNFRSQVCELAKTLLHHLERDWASQAAKELRSLAKSKNEHILAIPLSEEISEVAAWIQVSKLKFR